MTISLRTLQPALALMALGVACWPGQGAHAQSAAPVTTALGVSGQMPGETNIANLIGMKVVNDASEQLGDVNYLLVNASGQITTVVVGVGGVLGVGEKNVGFPYAAMMVSPSGKQDRVLKVSATKDQLAAAPKFEWREKPMAVTVEEGIKSAADKVKATAEQLKDKATDAIKKN